MIRIRFLFAVAIMTSALTCLLSSPNGLRAGRDWSLPSNAEIRELLAERMRHNGVGVVVGVIDSEGPRVVAYGRSGARDQRPLNGEGIFQIGSITKVFTTLLLADMVTKGEVDLDDPASRYLPAGITMPVKGRPITLKDLATHTSGLPSMPANFDIHGDPDPYEAYSVDELHEFLANYSLEREPGSKWAYSNLGVALLGRLLAHRAGIPYEPLLKQRILEPLGMTSTSITLTEEQSHRLMPGHEHYLRPVRTWEMATLPASGSLRSTAGDMLKFLAAYLGYVETPLKSAIALQLGEGVPLDDRYQALGWVVRSDGIVRHAGGKQGYRSGVAFDPQTGVGAVVLANARTNDLPLDIALHLVTGEPLAPAPHAPADKTRVDVSPVILDSYAGRYRFQNGGELEVARHESLLLVRYPSGAILEFAAMSPREFFYIAGNDDITFEVEASGRVVGLTLYGDGKAAGEGNTAQRLIPDPYQGRRK